MHILILNQFYPPDVAPTGQVAHDLAQCLVERGHSVSVICSRESYSGHATYAAREQLDGVSVQRLRAIAFGGKSHLRKLLSYASFYMLLFIGICFCRPRPDVVISLTTPPYVGLLARLVGIVRRWRRVHWIMDLYPDVLTAHGLLGYGTAGHLVKGFLSWLTRRELAGASLILTLGGGMAERVKVYVTGRGRVTWVPLWSRVSAGPVDESRVQDKRREHGWRDDELVFMYSGNMGLGHRFGEFLNAAAKSGGSQPGSISDSDEPARLTVNSGVPVPKRFVFAGQGKRRIQIETFTQAHPGVPVQLLPYAPMADLGVHLRSADVLLASLGAQWSGCMLPSKLQGMFAAGRPVVFVGPSDCTMARWIREAEAGWVVGPGDVSGLCSCLDQAADPEVRRQKGESAERYARKHFDRTVNCERIAVLLEEVTGCMGRSASG